MAQNTQTQQQINTLRTLQESYDALADAQSAQATSTALEAAKQAILNAIAAIDTSDLAKEGSVARIVSSKVPTVMECSYYPDVTFVRVGYDLGYYKWLRVDGYDMYLYTPSAIEIGVPCYSSINPQVEVGVVTFLKTVTLDEVAQESTSQDILTAVENIDFSSLAKEATLGTPLAGQPSTIFAAIAAVSQSDDSKQTIVDAINYMGGSATTTMTWAQLAQEIIAVLRVPVLQNELANGVSWDIMDLGQLLLTSIDNIRNKIKVLYTEKVTSASLFLGFTNLEKLYAPNLISGGRQQFSGCTNLLFADVRNFRFTANYSFQNCHNLRVLNLLNTSQSTSYTIEQFSGCHNLIDLIIGAKFTGDVSIFGTGSGAYNPTQAYRTDISTLCFDTDLEEYGQVFSNNFEKWKWCIINHFAANLQDRTGMAAYTITLGSTVLGHFDQDMIDAFTNKNWTLA